MEDVEHPQEAEHQQVYELAYHDGHASSKRDSEVSLEEEDISVVL
jgi:hypothetical protein